MAAAFTMLKECLGELPFVGGDEAGPDGQPSSTTVVAKAEGRPVVLADGSYATQTALGEEGGAAADPGAPTLRPAPTPAPAPTPTPSLILGGQRRGHLVAPALQDGQGARRARGAAAGGGARQG